MNPQENTFNLFRSILQSRNPSDISFNLDPVPISATLENLRLNTEIIIHNKPINQSQDENNNEEEICSICRQELEDKSILRKLKTCSHKFHLNCIDQWFEKQVLCPICRVDVRASVSRDSQNPQYQHIRNAINRNVNFPRYERVLSSSLPNNINSLNPPDNPIIDTLFNSILGLTPTIEQRGISRPLRLQTINISYETPSGNNNQSSQIQTNTENNIENNLNIENDIKNLDDLVEINFDREINRPISPPFIRRPEKSHRYPYSYRKQEQKKEPKSFFQKLFNKNKHK
jgi:hypothetical protein